jgi:hypothetical protein
MSGQAMDKGRIKEIEDKLADLKKRWPEHSASPAMWQELEDLEEELELARETGGIGERTDGR